MKGRIEKDSMGEVVVDEDSYWGAQTQRAVSNFTISSLRIPNSFLKALALIKKHAAFVNAKNGVIAQNEAKAIVDAADEILAGKWNDQFPVDVFQTGSGTSWNMNINEVLANRANEMLQHPKGTRFPIHPNDHVNKGQSSNDVIPSAMNIAAFFEAQFLVRDLGKLVDVIRRKEKDFTAYYKLGRTHLQDAVPMRVSDEFSAWKKQLEKAKERIMRTFPALQELALGGTAVGTGVNCPEGFAVAVIEGIAQESGIPFVQAENLFEAISSRDSILELMNALHSLAVALFKIAQDLRLLSSGPRCGFGELILPSLQPGSSIMPGKINPVIPEMTIQVAAYVMGKHASVSIGCQTSPLQLNIMMPLIASEVLSSLEILTACVRSLNEKCFSGITVDVKNCQEKIDWSLALVTPVALKLGYDKAAEIAHYAYKKNIQVKEALRELTDLTVDEIEALLDPAKMV